MIAYDVSGIGVRFIFRCHGSVFPKALIWAVPNMLLTFLLHYLWHNSSKPAWASIEGVQSIWSGYTGVLGFLIVFRNNQAYMRFWEGATLVNQVRGEWYNAVSSLFAFCDRDAETQEDVFCFQQLLVRLASMLYCSALQQVCDLDNDTLEIIKTDGMSEESLEYLQGANDRCEIILQWIQRAIIEAEASKVLKVPPPILSRSFQELSRGIVNLNNVRKIREIQFPFPYAQMVTCMLLVHWIVMPFLASQVITSPYWASLMCFFTTFAFWCLIYIAREIDQPFGSDANDLPLHIIQSDFNKSLLSLLDARAQQPPSFSCHTGDEEIKRNPSLRGSDSALKSLSHGQSRLSNLSSNDPFPNAPGLRGYVSRLTRAVSHDQSHETHGVQPQPYQASRSSSSGLGEVHMMTPASSHDGKVAPSGGTNISGEVFDPGKAKEMDYLPCHYDDGGAGQAAGVREASAGHRFSGTAVHFDCPDGGREFRSGDLHVIQETSAVGPRTEHL